MLCFEVWINGKRQLVVGDPSAEEYGVYLYTYPALDIDSAAIEGSGYAPSDQIHPDELTWGTFELQQDDEVMIRVVNTESPDIPTITRYNEGKIDDSQGVMICSNCGRSHLEIEEMITAQRIKLCGDCYRQFSDFFLEKTNGRC